jgi:hypothetical protein
MQTIPKVNKTLQEMEAEARTQHMLKVLTVKDGKTYAQFVESGQRVRFRDGKVYTIGEHGELRRVKE